MAGPIVFEAINMWKEKLGEPGRDTAIGFTVHEDDNVPILCRHPNGRWNFRNSFDSVIIMMNREQVAPAAATVGWRPSAFHGGNDDHFNHLYINTDSLQQTEAWVLAHELGKSSPLSFSRSRLIGATQDISLVLATRKTVTTAMIGSITNVRTRTAMQK